MSSRLSHDTLHSIKEPTHATSTITIQATPFGAIEGSRVDNLNPKPKQNLSFMIREYGDDLDSELRMRKKFSKR